MHYKMSINRNGMTTLWSVWDTKETILLQMIKCYHAYNTEQFEYFTKFGDIQSSEIWHMYKW